MEKRAEDEERVLLQWNMIRGWNYGAPGAEERNLTRQAYAGQGTHIGDGILIQSDIPHFCKRHLLAKFEEILAMIWCIRIVRHARDSAHTGQAAEQGDEALRIAESKQNNPVPGADSASGNPSSKRGSSGKLAAAHGTGEITQDRHICQFIRLKIFLIPEFWRSNLGRANTL
ncbi:hypothetical protein B0H17DRAFT_1140855 [Mycena rosella]|uniref:Uncharacterized protein n=1 Tax=Mycena rosella TaxID=1033263 RepID=A0AAD7D4R8_MYCRO|nr:hypothetical protein B0H17DRAFT_1140855 [Mycena rosella]